jgi:transposase
MSGLPSCRCCRTSRVSDRRVLNGISCVALRGAMARPAGSSCYNRLIRWRRAGGWAKIMNALAGAHDAAVQMIDTSIVRVHQHGACITRNRRQSMGPSRGGLTSKSHALVDTNGLPIRLAVTAGKAHDNRLAGKLLSCLESGTMLLADRGYEPLLATRALIQLASCGPTSHHGAIAKSRSASARISTALGTWSNKSQPKRRGIPANWGDPERRWRGCMARLRLGRSTPIRPRAGKLTPNGKSQWPLAEWSAGIRLLTRL